MIIFKYELLQLRYRIIIWSLVLAVLTIMILPIYVDMITSASEATFDSVQSQDFFIMLGTDFNTLRKPMGMYSFLTSFIFFACAVNGMSLGIAMFSKEFKNKTADFLLTKPQSRVNIFLQKFLAAVCTGVIIGLLYTLASVIAMELSPIESYNLSVLVQIGLSTIYIYTFFLVLGFLVGSILPNIGSSMPVSFAATFFAYVIQAFSNKTGVDFLGYFSPYTYFEGAGIIRSGSYDLLYMFLFIFISAGLIMLSLRFYVRHDVKTLT